MFLSTQGYMLVFAHFLHFLLSFHSIFGPRNESYTKAYVMYSQEVCQKNTKSVANIRQKLPMKMAWKSSFEVFR